MPRINSPKNNKLAEQKYKKDKLLFRQTNCQANKIQGEKQNIDVKCQALSPRLEVLHYDGKR